MPVDAQLAALARAVQNEHTVGSKFGALGPVRWLIAEFVYLEISPRAIYSFVQRAGIEISYSGMHSWIQRNLGTGPRGVRNAAKMIQDAVDLGVFSSPHFKPRRASKHVTEAVVERADEGSQDSAAFAGAVDRDPTSPKRHATPPTSAATPAPMASQKCEPGALELDPPRDTGPARTTPLEAEANAREADRMRLKEERVRKGRAYEQRMLEANPFRSIEQRQKLERLKSEGSGS